mmetsp:Transcript_13307/g.35308  ORF Transcript_13307/g.35308 Transcript_13307/m.35308 type:complete len:222 (-) Transcript_13307:2114-2779(-)
MTGTPSRLSDSRSTADASTRSKLQSASQPWEETPEVRPTPSPQRSGTRSTPRTRVPARAHSASSCCACSFAYTARRRTSTTSPSAAYLCTSVMPRASPNCSRDSSRRQATAWTRRMPRFRNRCSSRTRWHSSCSRRNSRHSLPRCAQRWRRWSSNLPRNPSKGRVQQQRRRRRRQRTRAFCFASCPAPCQCTFASNSCTAKIPPICSYSRVLRMRSTVARA